MGKFVKGDRKHMALIRSKNTKPEVIVRKYLFQNGFRYRIHAKKLPGTPDIVLKKYKTVIFINGCFWHGHINCSIYKIPKTNPEWWKSKISKNQQNDVQHKLQLRIMGWHVMTLWECQLKSNQREEVLKAMIYLLEKTFLDDLRSKKSQN